MASAVDAGADALEGALEVAAAGAVAVAGEREGRASATRGGSGLASSMPPYVRYAVTADPSKMPAMSSFESDVSFSIGARRSSPCRVATRKV